MQRNHIHVMDILTNVGGSSAVMLFSIFFVGLSSVWLAATLYVGSVSSVSWAKS